MIETSRGLFRASEARGEARLQKAETEAFFKTEPLARGSALVRSFVSQVSLISEKISGKDTSTEKNL